MSTAQDLPLSGRTIAMAESRELDLFAAMAERQGATVMRCPLVSIHDSPDADDVNAWIARLIEGEFDDVVLFTGEGLRRLRGFAARADLHDAFVTALGETRIVTRGPKPIKALREVQLRTEIKAVEPTTDGLIKTLRELELAGRRIGVQLYGSEPNEKFIGFLTSAGAVAFPVWPYVYASDAEDHRVVEMIDRLTSGQVDVMAFTSASQVQRLFNLAKRHGGEDHLRAALAGTMVAAIGPVAADELRKNKVKADVMPSGTFALKPLINALIRRVG